MKKAKPKIKLKKAKVPTTKAANPFIKQGAGALAHTFSKK